MRNPPKPTVKRCALKVGHEGQHMWINTRRLGQFGECRAFAPIESSPETDFRRLKVEVEPGDTPEAPHE